MRVGRLPSSLLPPDPSVLSARLSLPSSRLAPSSRSRPVGGMSSIPPSGSLDDELTPALDDGRELLPIEEK